MLDPQSSILRVPPPAHTTVTVQVVQAVCLLIESSVILIMEISVAYGCAKV